VPPLPNGHRLSHERERGKERGSAEEKPEPPLLSPPPPPLWLSDGWLRDGEEEKREPPPDEGAGEGKGRAREEQNTRSALKGQSPPPHRIRGPSTSRSRVPLHSFRALDAPCLPLLPP